VRVLLVEDDLMNQLIMKAKLKEVGAILSERGRSNTKGLDPRATNTQLPGSVMMASNNKLDCSFCDVEMDVVVASTAEKALDLPAAANNYSSSDSDSGGGGESQFNLIIMDQNLEGAGGVITGQEATVKLLANDCTAPIIMCTGNCSKEVISP
jgi:CheY-like chemotaxis protein